MAYKFVFSICALFAVAHAGAILKVAQPALDAVGTTHQNVVRSFGGTVSTYSKSVVTPYSSVNKVDSRTTNNVYKPAIAKSVSYAAPAAVYAHPAPVFAKTLYKAPAPAPVYYTQQAQAPVLVKHAISYSPAAAVAHVSFDGIGAHWSY